MKCEECSKKIVVEKKKKERCQHCNKVIAEDYLPSYSCEECVTAILKERAEKPETSYHIRIS